MEANTTSFRWGMNSILDISFPSRDMASNNILRGEDHWLQNQENHPRTEFQ